ncbi:hypothetical protein KAU32_09835 [bacterium]|nr:hypothetical protein [bacterium]
MNKRIPLFVIIFLITCNIYSYDEITYSEYKLVQPRGSITSQNQSQAAFVKINFEGSKNWILLPERIRLSMPQNILMDFKGSKGKKTSNFNFADSNRILYIPPKEGRIERQTNLEIYTFNEETKKFELDNTSHISKLLNGYYGGYQKHLDKIIFSHLYSKLIITDVDFNILFQKLVAYWRLGVENEEIIWLYQFRNDFQTTMIDMENWEIRNFANPKLKRYLKKIGYSNHREGIIDVISHYLVHVIQSPDKKKDGVPIAHFSVYDLKKRKLLFDRKQKLDLYPSKNKDGIATTDIIGNKIIQRRFKADEEWTGVATAHYNKITKQCYEVFNLKNGRLLWQKEIPPVSFRDEADFIYKDRIFLILENKIYTYRLEDGEEKVFDFDYKVERVMTTDEQVILFGTDKCRIYKLEEFYDKHR